MADIFVSYARADRDLVLPLVEAFQAEGWSVWWDPEIAPGVEFDRLIATELAAAKTVVVVWTPISVDSRWVKGEARDAADRGVLTPIRFNQAIMPIDFRAIHTSDMDDWAADRESAPYQSLRKSIRTQLNQENSTAPAVAVKPKRNPVGICVFPFQNMSGDPEQEYFSDGITEDIITDLSKVSALSIASRHTTFSLKGTSANVADIAKQTSAAFVLEGSVRKSGNRVRITAQLINTANDDHIWAERFDRDLDDIFKLQDEISEAIVKALKLTLLPEEKQALEHRSTGNSEAYKTFLMARQFSVMGNERHQKTIVRLCRHAVSLDPNYAQAWASLAIAQWELHRGDQRNASGEIAAEKAIALDPMLADAHAAIGAIRQEQGRYDEGLEACIHALSLDSNSYFAARLAGVHSMALGRLKDAVTYFEMAANIIDTEYYACSMVIQCYESLEEFDDAHKASKRAIERIEKIIAVEPDHGNALGLGTGALMRLGQTDRAKEWAARAYLLDPDNINLQFNIACAMLRGGEVEIGLNSIAGFIDRISEGALKWMRTDTDFDTVRDDPRFIAMLAKAEAQFKSGSA